jgi:hypothetical protein
MHYRTVTRSSVILATDEQSAKKAITETVHRLGGAYEVKLVVMSVMTVAEFYLDLNSPSTERSCLIKEILKTYETALAPLGKG